jgi:DNA modification methylase
MAKTLEDLATSREQRREIAEQLGGEIPTSILLHNSSDKAMDLLVEEHGRGYTDTGFAANNPDHPHAHLFKNSGMDVRQGALSRFPQNIGRILLRLYTKRGATVVDPFAGHNSRMELCWRDGRHYIGCDISHEFMQANFKLRERLLAENAADMFSAERDATITLHECDSRMMPVKNNTGDFTITSPPYWDIEYYGSEPQQLGRGNSYDEFLRRLGLVCSENFRCLRSGAFAVWCVNDFRKDGKFYSYHMHTAQLLRDAGFKQWDIAIIDLGNSMRAAFATQIVSTKILPKRHEYALIFVKP